jgi:myo-inositol-1(or 4)-monophosphatase
VLPGVGFSLNVGCRPIVSNNPTASHIAIDFAWLAAGKIDASITLNNKPWDTAAGVLIAREAGALVLDADGTQHSQGARATVAVSPGIRDEIIDLLKASGAARGKELQA